MVVISRISSVVPNENDKYPLKYKNAVREAFMIPEQIKQNFNTRFIKKRDTSVLYALIAAKELLDGMILDNIDSERIGIILSNTYGGWTYVEDQLIEMYQGSMDCINPYVATAWFATAAQGEISIQYGIKGYSKTICAGNLGGGLAIKHAVDVIQQGMLDYAISGGLEAPNNKLIYRLLQKDILVDGAVMFLLEDEDTATNQGHKPLLKIVDIKVSRKLDEEIILLARSMNALIYDFGISFESFGNLQELVIDYPFKKLDLFSFQIPFLIVNVYEKLKGTGRTVLINFKDSGQIFSILMGII